MVLVIGWVVLPDIPIALGRDGDLDFEGGKIAFPMSQFLADVVVVFFLPEEQQGGEHHNFVEGEFGDQVEVSQVPQNEEVLLYFQNLITFLNRQPFQLCQIFEFR